jgi:RNA polymerase sigma-70 factor (ECF subfamily)
VFRGWLFRVTTRLGHDYRRRKATRDLPGDAGLAEAAAQPPPDLEEDEYRRLLIRRGLDLIRPDFSEKTWAAFHGRAVDGRPAKELAAELGVTENAVYLAQNRVLTRLREELEGLLD